MTDEESGPRRRRRRRRATRGPGAPATADASAPLADQPAAPEPVPAPPKPLPAEASGKLKRRKPQRDAGPERGLRDLVGAGRSQVGVSGALRARDVNRPAEEDLAEAERDVVVIRRNWKPPGS